MCFNGLDVGFCFRVWVLGLGFLFRVLGLGVWVYGFMGLWVFGFRVDGLKFLV